MLGHTAFRSRPSSLALVFHSVLVSTFCMHPPMLLRIYASILSFLPVWMDPSLEAEGTGRQCKKRRRRKSPNPWLLVPGWIGRGEKIKMCIVKDTDNNAN